MSGRMAQRTLPSRLLVPIAVVIVAMTTAASAGVSLASPSFSNIRLTVPMTQSFPGITKATTGGSEPAISIANNGRVALDALSSFPFQVNVWSGFAGSPPSYFGAVDQNVDVHGNGHDAAGGFDADIDLGATGTLHLADLIVIGSARSGDTGIGVAETNCPSGATSLSQCHEQVLDTSGADRPWIASTGANVWVSYHDSRDSGLVRVKRSTDDGTTWTNVPSPIVGQGSATGATTFNNINGPIAADPGTGDLYDIYAAGQTNQKATSDAYDRIYVSRSADGGRSWTATLVFQAPPVTALSNVFPDVAVDPVTGTVYATWTDTHGVAVATSTDHGLTWTAPRIVSSIQTTVMPSVAAYNGKADVVYYGTAATSTDDSSARWNVYDAQLNNGSWQQLTVSNTPNHIGVVCLSGGGCQNFSLTRTLLDLFEVAENPLTGKASIVYTDDTFNTWTDNGTTYPLPEIVLAQQN